MMLILPVHNKMCLTFPRIFLLSSTRLLYFLQLFLSSLLRSVSPHRLPFSFSLRLVSYKVGGLILPESLVKFVFETKESQSELNLEKTKYRVFRAQADWTLFYRRNFLRKSCASCREKCRRAAPRTEKSDKSAQ
jgi:hypothetical protein